MEKIPSSIHIFISELAASWKIIEVSLIQVEVGADLKWGPILDGDRFLIAHSFKYKSAQWCI